MSKLSFTILCVIGAALPLAAGCGNTCDEVADKLDECGFEAPEGGEVEGDFEEAECTESREKQAECLLDKSCDALMSGEAFLDCGQ